VRWLGVTIKTRLMRTLELARQSAALPRVFPVAVIRTTQSRWAAHPALGAKRRMKHGTKGMPHTLVRAPRTMALQKTKAARIRQLWQRPSPCTSEILGLLQTKYGIKKVAQAQSGFQPVQPGRLLA